MHMIEFFSRHRLVHSVAPPSQVPNRTASTSIAVEMHGQDNYINNVIVFDYASVGVLVDGAATLLEGV
jgi:hypothetical protein